MFSKNKCCAYRYGVTLSEIDRNKYLIAYFSECRRKKIFNIVFTYHIDNFSKNGRRYYPYVVTLSVIRSKQVLIRLFSARRLKKIFKVVFTHCNDIFQKLCLPLYSNSFNILIKTNTYSYISRHVD